MRLALLVVVWGLTTANFAVAQSDGQVTTAIETSAPSTSDEPAVGQGKVTVSGISLEGQSNHSSLGDRKDGVATGLDLSLQYKLASWALLEFDPKFGFFTGHFQAATETNGRTSTVNLKDADVRFTDGNYVLARVGVVDVSPIHSKLLIDIPMTALYANFSTGFKRPLSVGWYGLGGIPFSATNSNNSDQVDLLPSFVSTGLYTRYRDDRFEFWGQLSWFQYANLSNSVASDSALYGNTQLGGGPTAAATPYMPFQYEYAGEELVLQTAYNFTPTIKWKFQTAWIRNERTIADYALGYTFYNEVSVPLGGGWTMFPNVTYFKVAPDATVADFNSDMFNTNRVGYLAGISFDYRGRFKFGGTGGVRDVLYDRTEQGREVYIGLNLETKHVSF